MRAASPGASPRLEALLSCLEAGCDIAVVVDDRGGVLHAGPATAARLGLEVRGQSWLGPRSAEDLRGALTEPDLPRRLRLWRRDGDTLRAVNATLSDRRADPHVGGVLVCGIDEASPSGSALSGRRFLRSLGIGSVMVAPDGRVSDADSIAAQILGLADAADVLGTRPFADAQLVCLDGADPQPVDVTDLARTDALAHLRLVLPDGSVTWVESRWERAPAGVHGWLRAPSHAFTAYAERELRERRLSALLGEVGDFVAVADEHGRLTWASPQAQAELDALGPGAGDGSSRYIHPEDREHLAALWQQVLIGGGRTSGQARVGSPAGPWRRACVTFTDRREDEAVGGIVVHGRDITDSHVSAEIRRGTQSALMAALAQDDPAAALEAICASVERALGDNHPGAGATIVYADSDGTGGRGLRRISGPNLRGVTLPEPSRNADPVRAGQVHMESRVLGAHARPFTHRWDVPLLGVDGQPLGALKVLHRADPGEPGPAEVRALERYAPLAALLVGRHLAHVGTHESEARFRSVFLDTAVPSALVTLDGRFLAVNPALEQLTDRPAELLVGTAVADLEQPLAAPADDRPARPWVTGSGRTVWVERTASEVHSPDRKALYRVEHYVDVTARRTTEDEVLLLNEMLTSRVADLDATRDRLAAAFRKITQVREDERRNLAVVLHDDTVQQLIVATWLLEELDPEETNPEVAAVRAQLQATIDGVRGIITTLRPATLDSLGLAGALENRARHILGPAVELTVSDELPEALPEDLQTLVFRTALEALRNIRKHAGASTVEVAVGQISSTVVVKIVDDGRGFDPAHAARLAAEGHIGVTSMREEIVLAGGRFHIGSRSDTLPGTEVSFALPRVVATDAELPS